MFSLSVIALDISETVVVNESTDADPLAHKWAYQPVTTYYSLGGQQQCYEPGVTAPQVHTPATGLRQQR